MENKETYTHISESPIDKLISWTERTEMKQISIGMLNDWFKELKDDEAKMLLDVWHDGFTAGRAVTDLFRK